MHSAPIKHIVGDPSTSKGLTPHLPHLCCSLQHQVPPNLPNKLPSFCQFLFFSCALYVTHHVWWRHITEGRRLSDVQVDRYSMEFQINHEEQTARNQVFPRKREAAEIFHWKWLIVPLIKMLQLLLAGKIQSLENSVLCFIRGEFRYYCTNSYHSDSSTDLFVIFSSLSP